MPKKLPEFDAQDVLKIARAILEDPVQCMSGDFVTYFWCEHCDAEIHGYQYGATDLKHDLDCPVLVAQDILVGSGYEVG